MKKKIVVTGGAGYIGSHTILEILEQGQFDVICLDNFINSNNESILAIENYTGKKVQSFEIDLSNYSLLKDTLNTFDNQIIGIIHFAALKAVGESVEYPIEYYQNNLNSTLNTLKICEELNIPNYIFSSSCSVYGNIDPEKLPVKESTICSKTESPYAETKSMGERMMEDIAKNNKVKCLALRYFNPVGAQKEAIIGENPKSKPNNLVPVICKAALGKTAPMSVFGNDYPTRDGTCIRDYIHVVDIAKAHVKAMSYLSEGQKLNFDVINLGSGNGVSVLEAIQAFEKVSGVKLPYIMAPRRSGDVIAVYSDSSKALDLLGWKADLGIEEMMSSAWKWENKLA